MDKADLVNGIFESFGALAVWSNFVRLLHDREVKGVYWPLWLMYSAWGVWNLFYYPFLGQPISTVAGVAVCAGNIAWTAAAWKFSTQR